MLTPMFAVVLLLQVAIFAAFVEGVRRRSVSVAVNALVALCATLFPAFVEFALRGAAGSIGFSSELSLWIGVAGILHSLGMLGLYESTWWWDHLTHTVSSTLVAALVYAGVLVISRQTPSVGLSTAGIASLTLIFTFAIGVFWELIELVARDIGERYDIEPVLVHYGWHDTALDLGFDVLGALLIIVLDLRIFVPITSRFPSTTRTLLIGSAVLIFVGSVVMALALALNADR